MLDGVASCGIKSTQQTLPGPHPLGREDIIRSAPWAGWPGIRPVGSVPHVASPRQQGEAGTCQPRGFMSLRVQATRSFEAPLEMAKSVRFRFPQSGRTRAFSSRHGRSPQPRRPYHLRRRVASHLCHTSIAIWSCQPSSEVWLAPVEISPQVAGRVLGCTHAGPDSLPPFLCRVLRTAISSLDQTIAHSGVAAIQATTSLYVRN